MPLFCFSLFKAHITVINDLERICRRFLWGGTEERNKICLVNWKTVFARKDNGGLGLGSLQSINLSLLLKWIWRFKMGTKIFGGKLLVVFIISWESLWLNFPNSPFLAPRGISLNLLRILEIWVLALTLSWITESITGAILYSGSTTSLEVVLCHQMFPSP